MYLMNWSVSENAGVKLQQVHAVASPEELAASLGVPCETQMRAGHVSN